MYYIVFGQELQRPCDLKHDSSDLVLAGPDNGVELFVVDAVHFLVVVIFAFELVQGIAQGVAAFLV